MKSRIALLATGTSLGKTRGPKKSTRALKRTRENTERFNLGILGRSDSRGVRWAFAVNPDEGNLRGLCEHWEWREEEWREEWGGEG
jgi:hypothetical protein